MYSYKIITTIQGVHYPESVIRFLKRTHYRNCTQRLGYLAKCDCKEGYLRNKLGECTDNCGASDARDEPKSPCSSDNHHTDGVCKAKLDDCGQCIHPPIVTPRKCVVTDPCMNIHYPVVLNVEFQILNRHDIKDCYTYLENKKNHDTTPRRTDCFGTCMCGYGLLYNGTACISPENCTWNSPKFTNLTISHMEQMSPGWTIDIISGKINY